MAIVMKFGRRESEVASAGCTTTEQVGDCVYIYNTIAGQKRVRRVDPRDQDKMPVYGIVISKQSDILCRVQKIGETPAVFTGLDIGEIYFVDLEGKITRTPPLPLVGGYSIVQSIGIATAEDKLEVIVDTTLTRRINP